MVVVMMPSWEEGALIGVFVLRCVAVFLESTYLHSAWWFWGARLGAAGVQALPLAVLCAGILRQGAFGPRPAAKAFLAAACVLQLAMLDPWATWALLLPRICLPLVSFLSPFDLLVGPAHALALAFFFAFMAKEYVRQREECMYQFVRHAQSGMDFRAF